MVYEEHRVTDADTGHLEKRALLSLNIKMEQWKFPPQIRDAMTVLSTSIPTQQRSQPAQGKRLEKGREVPIFVDD